MRAVILSGTLKTARSGEFSHTEVLCRLLEEALAPHDISTETIRLVDHTILPGIKSDMGEDDEWPSILKLIFAADIVIFATPIWWGNYSSLIQRAIERMDELNDEIISSGKSELAGKVGGIVISGEEDGAEHLIGMLANFMIWNGLTLPPACSLSYLGSYRDLSADALYEKLRAQPYTHGMAKTMARNLAHMARLLKDKPLPIAEKGAQSLR